MPVVPFLPAIAATAGGIFGGKAATASAMKRSPEERAALAGATGAAGQLQQQSGQLMGQGLPYLRQAGTYYSTLLGGNRAQMAQATAAPRAAVTDIYRGAESNLERSGVRGASRDVAKAELGRDRASRIAGLTTGVQPAAAGALGELGSGLVSSGQYGVGQAGSIYGNLLDAGARNREYGRAEGERTSQALGGLIFDILTGTMGSRGKIPTIPSRPIGTGMGWSPSL